MRRFAALFACAVLGCNAPHLGEDEPVVQGWDVELLGHQRTPRLDLLFVLDNSVSMADKQQLLKESLPEWLRRLTTRDGQPSPVNLHLGVITTSLGAHGGDICAAPVKPGDTPNDQAHLVGSLRNHLRADAPLGFLSWAPESPTPADTEAIAEAFGQHVMAAGEQGCGFEAPLEAWYRFLIDPEPPRSVTRQDGFAVAVGIDHVVLQQRRDFLRGDSQVVIVMVTDENDCSIRDGGQGILGQAWILGSEYGDDGKGLPRGTATCTVDPSDPCCHSCGQGDVPGCPPVADDPECKKGWYGPGEDPHTLRCWDQKRRYGVDWLYPIERYVEGLTSPHIVNRSGQEVPNPLFLNEAGTSRPNHDVTLVGIVGVPWQLIATPQSLDPVSSHLSFRNATELKASGTWEKIAPNGNQPPKDPHMVESVLPRSGLPGPSAGAMADPFHGHEHLRHQDLQYACISALRSPHDCKGKGAGCDCRDHRGLLVPASDPLCQQVDGTYSTTQRFAKAYPGLRQLQVLRDLGERGVVGSICPKNPGGDPASEFFGFAPALQPIVARVQTTSPAGCLRLGIDTDPQLVPTLCVLAEAIVDADCDAPLRKKVAASTAKVIRQELARNGQCGPNSVGPKDCNALTVCAIEPAQGADRDACLNDENTSAQGWCLIDRDTNHGNLDLLSTCYESAAQRLRFVGEAAPRPGAQLALACKRTL